MKMCELAEIYRHGTETPIKKNPDVGTHFTSNGKHAEFVQVWEPVKYGELKQLSVSYMWLC